MDRGHPNTPRSPAAVHGPRLSGVPGGAGVFETAMLKLLPQIDRTNLAAAFLGFRLFYYLTPLVIGLGMLLLIKLSGRDDAEANQQK